MSVDHVELVLFTVGATRYGASLTQVSRVDLDEPAESVGVPLGPCTGRRALVFSPSSGVERRLRIDGVLGVRRVPADSLRRLPRVLAAPPMAIGAWIDGEQPVVLIDLHALVMPAARSP